MSLVLAIEPDRRQAAHIANVVRKRVGAQLILVDTTEHALAALNQQAPPDLVLVPALLSPKDDAMLAEALKAAAESAPIRVLITPLLSTAKSAAREGLIGRLRRGRSNTAPTEGCDPEMFAEQIAAYLTEAGTQPQPAGVSFDIPIEATAIDEDLVIEEDQSNSDAEFMSQIAEEAAANEPVVDLGAIDEDRAALDTVAADESPALAEWAMPQEAATLEEPLTMEAPASVEEPAPVAETLANEAVAQPAAWQEDVDEPAMDVLADWLVEVDPDVAALSDSTPIPQVENKEWRDLVESFRRAVGNLRFEEWFAESDTDTTTTEPKRAQGDRKTVKKDLQKKDLQKKKPAAAACDEWGIYDPERCGIAALEKYVESLRTTDTD